jgi:hypothetical protein
VLGDAASAASSDSDAGEDDGFPPYNHRYDGAGSDVWDALHPKLQFELSSVVSGYSELDAGTRCTIPGIGIHVV